MTPDAYYRGHPAGPFLPRGTETGQRRQLRHCESGPIVLVLAPMANILRWHFACQLRETGKNQEPLITKFFT
jgi:hypothetical protein